ncbi:hypothetical protein IF2G_10658 [Cordyceps javanica]|nr:hypothetical protein IF2G_10658 [Cordyceps javanica]
MRARHPRCTEAREPRLLRRTGKKAMCLVTVGLQSPSGVPGIQGIHQADIPWIPLGTTQ